MGTPRSRAGGKKWLLGFILATVVVLVSWVLVSQWQKGMNTAATPISDPLPTGQTEEITLTFTDTLTSTTLPTLEITIPYMALGMETPLGLDHHFVIHRVQAGESLEFIAQQYGTTVESLQGINYQLPSPLLPGIIIIVPVSFAETQDLPPFVALEILSDIYLSDLAEQLAMDLAELRYYNGFEGEVFLRAGDWILLPQESYTP